MASLGYSGRATRWFGPDYDATEATGDVNHPRAEALMRAASLVQQRTANRQDSIVESYCLYGDEEASIWLERVGGSTLSDNVIASVTDAVVAEVTQSEPSPFVQCWGADYDEQQRAEELTQYLATAWEHCSGPDLWSRCVKDACIAGLGIMRAVRVGDDVTFERLHPLSILVDDRACIDVEPRELYVRRAISREHMQALYPELESEIAQAERPTLQLWTGLESTDEVVLVIEGWHLPSVPGADDGRHTIACSTAVLSDTVYSRPRYPLGFIRALEPSRGFWGGSRVQRMASLQEELNKQLKREQDAMHSMSVPRVWVRSGLGPPAVHINNDIGAIMESAEPPVFFPPATAIGSEGLQYVGDIRQRLYAAGGSSELAASLQKPAGLDSGRSQRIFREWGTRLHAPFSRRAGRAAAHACEDYIALQREIAEEKRARGEQHKVYYVGKDGSTPAVDWFALDVDRDRMRVTIAAINALSRDPAERMGQCRDLVADAVIQPKDFVRLIGTADFDQIRGEIDAPEDLIRQQVGRILKGGPYTPPEPYMDLQLCVLIGSRELQRAELRGCPEERLSKMRQWLLDTKTRIDESLAPAAPNAETTATGIGASSTFAAGGPAMSMGAPMEPAMGGEMGGEMGAGMPAMADAGLGM
jgi:hypothetical protein